MATTDAARTEAGRSRHRRHATVVAAVVLAFAAMVVPFALHTVGGGGAHAAPAAHVGVAARTTPGHGQPAADPAIDPALGSHRHLPALLPARTGAGGVTRVRLGDVTTGFLRRTPDGSWQVVVRWNGALQPVPTRRSVSLGGRPGQAATWVSADGSLYTRVALAGSHAFRVYAWHPRGGTAYTPPTLVPRPLGRVCFDDAFTAFGNCRTTG